MLTIDGSMGEGGGQILRSSVGLAVVTGTPFRIDNIRAKRKKPGLMRQHLTAVQAAARIGCAKVDGDHAGSTSLTFEPGGIEAGEYHFAIGTAGSTSLVLQAILPALLIASGPSKVVIEGGTHNPWAPPFDFLTQAFLPLLERMGARVQIAMERPGFFPAGGGRIVVDVHPVSPERGLQGIEVIERGALIRRLAVGAVANLPRSIADRELKVIGRKLNFEASELSSREIPHSRGPGNLVTIELEYEHVAEVFTGFGEQGKSAENVAGDAVHQYKAYQRTEAPVGRHLADQLMIPLGMAGSGRIYTMPLSRHAKTNIQVVEAFLPVRMDVQDHERGAMLTVVPTA